MHTHSPHSEMLTALYSHSLQADHILLVGLAENDPAVGKVGQLARRHMQCWSWNVPDALAASWQCYHIAGNFHRRKFLRILQIHCHLQNYFPQISCFIILRYPCIRIGGEVTEANFAQKSNLRLLQKFSPVKISCYTIFSTGFHLCT